MYTDITLIICITIGVLALIAAGTILTLRQRDAKVKSEAEARQRVWDEEDKKKKLEAEIINKKLSFLDELVKKESKLKSLSKEECTDYLEMLDKIICQNTDQTSTNEK
jgi:hypothetical protein